MKIKIPEKYDSSYKEVEIEIPFYIYWDLKEDIDDDICDIYIKITKDKIYKIKYKNYLGKEEYSFEVIDNNWKYKTLYKYYLEDKTTKEKYQEIKKETEKFISENFN